MAAGTQVSVALVEIHPLKRRPGHPAVLVRTHPGWRGSVDSPVQAVGGHVVVDGDGASHILIGTRTPDRYLGRGSGDGRDS